MDAAKVDTIINMPVPTTAAKLHSFVCLMGYYRQFIMSFADLSRPLMELVKAEKYNWTEVHQNAFVELKRRMLAGAVLAHPDSSKVYYLECDASNFGLGYILAQSADDGRMRAICFGSRALTPTEQNYAATERECLAVVEGVKKYHVYLHGNKFVVVTDHKALIWLMNHADPTSKLMRWAVKLQGYEFSIIHRAGKASANVDALSRLVESAPRHKFPSSTKQGEVAVIDYQEEIAVIEHELEARAALIKAQWADPLYRQIVRFLRDDELPKDAKQAKLVVALGLHMGLDEGILVHYWWPEDKKVKQDTRRQIAIPESWKTRVLEECHDSPMTGAHLGFTKTHLKIRERYWWKQMYSECKDYVESCIPCQQRKGTQPTNAGVMQSMVASEAWELVGMDIYGPIAPITVRGKRYCIIWTCSTTKFVVGATIAIADEATSAEKLIKKVILRHGVMRKLVSDRGSNFVAIMINEVYKLLKIHKINTTAWHPQGNVFPEHFNWPLGDMLAINMWEHPKDWDLTFPYVLFAWNASVQDSCKFSPFYLTYGREPCFIMEIASGVPNYPGMNGYASLAEEYAYRFKTGFVIAMKNNEYTQQKTELRGQHTHTPVTYKVGEKVWLYTRARTEDGQSAKLKFPWQGPYTVTKQITPNTVGLKEHTGKRLGQYVHVNRLKPFVERRPDDELILMENDDFDYRQELTKIDGVTMGDAEVPPDEEEIIKEIKNYRVQGNGDLQFWVTWEGGDQMWEPEIHVEDTVALTEFFTSRRKEPFFGLRIKFEQFSKLFKRAKYSYHLAIEQIIAVLKEFTAPDGNQSEAIKHAQSLYGIGEVK